jgi:hypothetical protein
VSQFLGPRFGSTPGVRVDQQKTPQYGRSV